MVLAEAYRGLGNEDRARLELRAAHSALERIGARSMALTAARACGEGDLPAATAPPPPGPAPEATNVFSVEGDTRSVVFDGRAVLVRDLKGMRYLARLLAEPGREFHVLDLVASERGATPPVATDSDLGPALDTEAKNAYRRRLRDIEDDLEEATLTGDSRRAALAEADRDYIVGELARAFGLGGRSRPVGSSSERARASVTRALRYALDRVAAHHPALAEHLGSTVRTGTYCAYVPDPRVPIRWTL
jgi:hypothetical protein